jgi:hypothetical protein
MKAQTSGIRVTLAGVKLESLEEMTPFNRRLWEKMIRRLSVSRPRRESMTLESVLNKCGPECAFLALGATRGHLEATRLYACRCARLSLPYFSSRYPKEERLKNALDAAERYALGQGDRSELAQARSDLKEIHEDLYTDYSLSSFFWDRLRLTLFAVAFCVDGSPLEYNHRLFRAKDARVVFNDSLTSIALYCEASILEEDEGKNAFLLATNPAEANVSSFFKVPALERRCRKILKNADEAVKVLAGDAAEALARRAINLPPIALKFAAANSIFEIMHKKITKAMRLAAKKTAKNDLLIEFRRLCRLEEEYGEISRRTRATHKN